VPDALPLPPDLVQLQAERLAAEAALAEFTNRVERDRRERFPSPEQIVERRTWSTEENAEHGRLQVERDRLAAAVRQHPTIVQAHADRCWPQTWDALQSAARE
jgi:hypothetical protein